MPEGKKYLESRELSVRRRPESVNGVDSRYSTRSRRKDTEEIELIVSDGHGIQEQIDAVRVEIDSHGQRASWSVFLTYFGEWRHLKTLLGTMSCWFLLDVAFYGTNLNQSAILSEIGFSTVTNEYDMIKRNAIGNLIIAVAGYVPGSRAPVDTDSGVPYYRANFRDHCWWLRPLSQASISKGPSQS